MMDEPGSFSGMDISPMAHRGPEFIQRISFAIFMSAQATLLRAPLIITQASLAARASNLFGADVNEIPVSSEITSAIRCEYPFGVFIPVPTAVPPQSKFFKVLTITFKRFNSMIYL